MVRYLYVPYVGGKGKGMVGWYLIFTATLLRSSKVCF